jgi:cytochrome c-type biogenesis protein CcmH/NrfG
MYFYKSVKDADNFLKAARAYQKTSVKNNAARLHDLTIDLTRSFPEDKKVMEQAEKWARSAAETGGLADYWMTLAGIYKLQGDKKKALDAANNALDAAGNNDAMLKYKIDNFIQSLQ